MTDQKTQNKTPKVSVTIPVYNTDPAHLRAALESILNQTFGDFELLVVNNSPDRADLTQIIHSYDDPRIFYHENRENLGISATRNQMVEMARGEYIAILDHDDIAVPTRLEKQAGYLDANPRVGVVSSNVEFFPKSWNWTVPEKNIDIKTQMLRDNVVPHTAMMIRKAVLLDTGIRYEEKFSPAEDYMLVIRLMEHTMFYNFQESLVKYRWHENNASHFLKDRMDDVGAMGRCVARRIYPYLWERLMVGKNPDKVKTVVYLFSKIPLLKIKKNRKKTRVYLFGFIPLFSIKVVA